MNSPTVLGTIGEIPHKPPDIKTCLTNIAFVGPHRLEYAEYLSSGCRPRFTSEVGKDFLNCASHYLRIRSVGGDTTDVLVDGVPQSFASVFFRFLWQWRDIMVPNEAASIAEFLLKTHSMGLEKGVVSRAEFCFLAAWCSSFRWLFRFFKEYRKATQGIELLKPVEQLGGELFWSVLFDIEDLDYGWQLPTKLGCVGDLDSPPVGQWSTAIAKVIEKCEAILDGAVKLTYPSEACVDTQILTRRILPFAENLRGDLSLFIQISSHA